MFKTGRNRRQMVSVELPNLILSLFSHALNKCILAYSDKRKEEIAKVFLVLCKVSHGSLTVWCTPLIPAVGMQSQVDLCEFQVSLIYKSSSRTKRPVTQSISVSGKKRKVT